MQLTWMLVVSSLLTGALLLLSMMTTDVSGQAQQISAALLPSHPSPDAATTTTIAPTAGSSVVSSVVLVSCNKHNYPQDYWRRMADVVHADLLGRPIASPCEPDHSGVEGSDVHKNGGKNGAAGICRLDAFIWLGDVVYADTSVHPGYWVSTPVDQIADKYRIQHACPQYQYFLKHSVKSTPPAVVDTHHHAATQGTPRVLGVWDDHDFGMNDGGREYADKDAVQQLFLDFLGEPPPVSFPPSHEEDGDHHRGESRKSRRRSIRRERKGLYSFQVIPFDDNVHSSQQDTTSSTSTEQPPSSSFEFAFCVILLDVRYFREPFTAARSGDMLGEEQWAWLDGILAFVAGGDTNMPLPDEVSRFGGDVRSRSAGHNSPRCAAVLIGGGIQFILDEKPTEHWGNFPKSRDRLLTMLRTHNVERVVLLSGDVHLGEIGWDATNDAVSILGYPLVEITSSGLTHSAASIPLVPLLFEDMFPSPRRVGVYLGKNFGSVTLEKVEANRGLTSSNLVVVLRIHKLDEQQGGSPRTVVEHRVRLNQIEYATAEMPAGVPDRTALLQYPDSAPGAIKRILMATQKHVFPNMKFHQLINMYVLGALIGILVLSLLILRCVWRGVRRCWSGATSRRKVD